MGKRDSWNQPKEQRKAARAVKREEKARRRRERKEGQFQLLQLPDWARRPQEEK